MENLYVRIKAIDDFSGTFKKVEGSTSKWGKGVAVAGAVAAVGIAAATTALYSCAKEAIEAEKVTAQTNKVLETTGGVANVSAQQVDDLATAISRKSGIDDEAIKSGENLLLTFTNIRNEAGEGNNIFDRATGLMADLSVRFGMDMPSAAKMMGKALNDPMKGLTALSRAGVQFSAGQKEQIENFVKSGDIMSAQKVILAELTTQVGGAAEAYGNTFAGKVDRLKVLFDEIKEKIGTKVVEALTKFADWVLRNWPQIESTISTACGVITSVWNALQGAAEWLGGAIEKSVNFIINAWKGISKYAQIAWTEVRLAVQTGVVAVLGIISGFVGAMAKVPVVGRAFKGVDKTIKESVASIKGDIADTRAELDRLNGNADRNTTAVTKSFTKMSKQAGGDFGKMYDKFIQAQADGNPKMKQGAEGAMKNILSAIMTNTPGITGNIGKCVDLMVGKITQKDFKMPTGQKLIDMATAISAQSGVPRSQVEALLNNMTGLIDNKDFKTPGAKTVNRFSEGVGGTVGTAIGAANSLAAQVASAFGNGNYAGAGNKAGSEFGSALVGPAIAAAQQVANQVASILGGAAPGKGTGGGVYATGGEVQQFASGGGVGKPVPAVLHTGEYVVRRSAVQKVGVKKLDAINRGASPGGGGLVVNINAGAFAGSQAEARRFASWLQKYLATEGAR